MKKYEAPEITLKEIDTKDVITTSRGDTPLLDYEW